MKALGAGIAFSVIGTTLALIATLASGVMTTGIFSGLVGFAVSTVGIAPVDATRRFTFGMVELNSGFSILAVLVGMFAIAEVIKVAEGGRAGSNIKIMAPPRRV